MKFVLPGRLDGVSLAVESLMAVLEQNAPAECRQQPNTLRRESCYRVETDLVLRKHEGPLRLIFDEYAGADLVVGDPLPAADAMGHGGPLTVDPPPCLRARWCCRMPSGGPAAGRGCS